MKKILLKLSIITFLIGIFMITSVYADENDDFIVHAKEAMQVNVGETIDVPIILSNIEVNDVQKGIMGVSFQIEYDEEAFELIKYENDSYFQRFVGNSESRFNEEDLISVIYCDANNYIDSVTELGTIKLRAKEGVPTGYYNLAIRNVKGGNLDSTDMDISSKDVISPVYVIGQEEDEYDDDEGIVITDGGELRGGEDTTVISEDNEISAKYQQNKKGTSLKITIDAENGTEVSKILIDDKEMTLKDGAFTAEVEPYVTYVLRFYNADGDYIFMKSVTILNMEDEQTTPTDDLVPVEDKTDDKTNDKTDDKSDDEKEKENEKDDEQESKETDKKDENKKNNNDNKGKNGNIDKSAQTGDNLTIAITLLSISIIALIAMSIVTFKVTRK